jgi:hypothetical protein
VLYFYPVEVSADLKRGNPLYVGNFYDLTRLRWKTRKIRQGLIISVALAWYRLIKKNPTSPGFINEEVLLTALNAHAGNSRHILERFFTITRVGFNFNNGNKSPTNITPRKLGTEMWAAVEEILGIISYSPGLPPTDKEYVVSDLKISQENSSAIQARLKRDGRDDLLPAVCWLLQHQNIKFYYEPAGKLQARDKSVWPIRAIEMWPGWLRTELFGAVIDIENAYCQFLIAKLVEKYADNPGILQRRYPDLLRADSDKQNFRDDICLNLLKLPADSDGISVVKKVMMALANGSNISALILTSGGSQSEAARLVLTANPALTPLELIAAGDKLGFIARQFKAAKKDVCLMLGMRPTRENQKQIFKMYMQWERASRYAIWSAMGKTGLHLHDGIDGAEVGNMTDADIISFIERETSIRVSVDRPQKAGELSSPGSLLSV